ncbi:MAG: HAD family phosphatase [Clostridia bacterium]|nr:HAD family phosphatase [Clostridia bacterium]
MAIKNVVFDLGGVLIDFNEERMLRDNIPAELHSAVSASTFHSEEWKMMDSGALEVDQAVDRMLTSLPEEIHGSVRSMIVDREVQMPPIDGMTEIIDTLYKNGYTLYVLSNCAKWLHEFLKEKVPSGEKFSGLIVSADYGIIKPDERIYNILFSTYSLKAVECFFIDDSPANIETARKLGMAAHCFKDRDFNRLREDMANSGITL